MLLQEYSDIIAAVEKNSGPRLIKRDAIPALNVASVKCYGTVHYSAKNDRSGYGHVPPSRLTFFSSVIVISLEIYYPPYLISELLLRYRATSMRQLYLPEVINLPVSFFLASDVAITVAIVPFVSIFVGNSGGEQKRLAFKNVLINQRDKCKASQATCPLWFL